MVVEVTGGGSIFGGAEGGSAFAVDETGSGGVASTSIGISLGSAGAVGGVGFKVCRDEEIIKFKL